MARLFSGKKETKDQHIDVTSTKKRFGLFRRGRSETPALVTHPEPERVSPERKTQSFRISVYEVRNDSPTPTCSSTEEARDERGRFDIRERFTGRRRSRSPSKRQNREVSRRRSRSPTKSRRSKSLSNVAKKESAGISLTEPKTRRTPGRSFSDQPVTTEARSDSLSPRRSILKRATFSMGNKSPPSKPKLQPKPIASFDLDMARLATSLTDNMSTESSDQRLDAGGLTANYPLEGRDDSFVIHSKRAVSFSKDVVDPKPKPSGVASLCIGTRSGRRVPRQRGDFSLTNEFEDLCFDLTYFCRCIGEGMAQGEVKAQDEGEKKISNPVPNIPEDDQTNDSSTFEISLDRSVGSI